MKTVGSNYCRRSSARWQRIQLRVVTRFADSSITRHNSKKGVKNTITIRAVGWYSVQIARVFDFDVLAITYKATQFSSPR